MQFENKTKEITKLFDFKSAARNTLKDAISQRKPKHGF